MLLISNYPEVSNIGFSYNGGTLTVSWSANAAYYTVRYRLQENIWQYAPNTSIPSINITGLTLGMLYQFEVTAVYASGPSLPRSAGFVVPSGQTPPAGLVATGKTATTMTLSWTGNPAGNTVNWQPAGASFDELQSAKVNGNTYTITDLDPNVNYLVWVERYYQDERLASSVLDKDTCCVTPAGSTTPPVVVVEFEGDIDGGYY